MKFIKIIFNFYLYIFINYKIIVIFIILNLTLPYISKGIYPNIEQHDVIEGDDYNGNKRTVTFTQNLNLVLMAIV